MKNPTHVAVGATYRGTGGVGVLVRVEEINDENKRARCTLLRSGATKWISLATLRTAYEAQS